MNEEKDFDEAKDIECPFCEERQCIDLCEGDTGLVTYWGEDAVEHECVECGKPFIIQEEVKRSWSVRKEI